MDSNEALLVCGWHCLSIIESGLRRVGLFKSSTWKILCLIITLLPLREGVSTEDRDAVTHNNIERMLLFIVLISSLCNHGVEGHDRGPGCAEAGGVRGGSITVRKIVTVTPRVRVEERTIEQVLSAFP